MADIIKVVIYTHDPMLFLVRTKEQCDELFGEDYFDEYAKEVPKELADEIQATYEKLKNLSRHVMEYDRPHKYKELCPIVKEVAIDSYMQMNKREFYDRNEAKKILEKSTILFTKNGKIY